MAWGTRPKISNKLGIPTPREGSDGDTQIRQTNLGAKLYGKIGGRWYSTFLSKEEEILGTSGTSIGMSTDGALTVDQINLTGKISLKSSGTENVCIGTDNSDIGEANVYIGVGAGESAVAGMDNNIAIGRYAMQGTATGSNARSNVAIGTLALQGMDGTADTVSENHNIAIGHSAGRFMDEGYRNIMIGTQALHCATSGNPFGISNVAIGYHTMYNAESAVGNVIIGEEAGIVIDEGDYNTCVGFNAGGSLTTGSNNLLLGKDSGKTGSPGGAFSTGSNTIVLGDENITAFYCADDSIATSDTRDKADVSNFNNGLDWINAMRPVTFKWDKRSWYIDRDAPDFDMDDVDLNSIIPDGTHKKTSVNIGFLAQEILEIEKANGFGSNNDTSILVDLTEDEKQYGLKYSRLTPILVKAVQELSAKVDTMQTEINNLKSE